MLKKLRIFTKIIGWVVFVFLFCILLVLISPKLPIKNVPKSFVVVTGSMEPTIKTGSVAFVKNVDPKNVKVGDIIAFTSPSDPNDTILHRVNSISSTDPLLFKTKGDNNNGIDAWDVPDVGVKGVYIAAIPYLGLIAAFIKKPLGFGLIIGIPALLFIIFQLFTIKKAIAEEIERKVSQKINEAKKSDSTKTTLKSIIFFAIFISASFSLSTVHIIKAVFSDTVTVSGITISTADFTKPSVPVLTSPADNIIRSTTGLVMKWSSSTGYSNTNTPIYYIYQSSHSSDFSTLAYTSNPLSISQISASGTPNGVYYWHVKACYDINDCSDWSEKWTMTIDSTLPTSVINAPVYSNNDNELEFPIVYSWNGKVDGTAADNFSGVDRVELSIQDLGTSLFWSGTGWTGGTESTVRVTAIGTTTWSYQIGSSVSSSGKFKIIAHAIDKAGNIENSATIEFENRVPVETITPTETPTPTNTLTPTPTPTDSVTPTPTETPTITPTPTDSVTPTPTETPTITPTPTGSVTPIPTETLILTPTGIEVVSISTIKTFNC